MSQEHFDVIIIDTGLSNPYKKNHFDGSSIVNTSMLQLSPTYMLSRPAIGTFTNRLSKTLPVDGSAGKKLPKQGDKNPRMTPQNYLLNIKNLKFNKFHKDTMAYRSATG